MIKKIVSKLSKVTAYVETFTELAARDVAHRCAWVFGVNPGVKDAVEGHCGTASADHRKDDVEEFEGRGIDVEIEVTPG